MPKIDVNIQSSSFVCPDDVDRGFTALHLACQHRRIDIVKLLLLMPNIDVIIQTSKSGSDGDGFCSRSYHESFTALHFVAINNDIEIAKLLLSMPNIDVNIQNSSNRSGYDKFTPLHFAPENNYVEIVKLLLSMPDININICTSSLGFTALHFAVRNNCVENAKLLLSMPNINLKIKSAPPNFCGTMVDFSYRSMTPLKIALCNGNIEIIKLLFEKKKIKIDLEELKDKIAQIKMEKKSRKN